jgi:hypothetical protein
VHWALTYNDATQVAELFINGVSQGTRPSSLGDRLPLFSAGGATDRRPRWWNGVMEEVAVYESVLLRGGHRRHLRGAAPGPALVRGHHAGRALAQELTGARINDVLGTGDPRGNGIGSIPQWPTAWRSIDVGNALVQAVTQANDVSRRRSR